MKCSSSKLIKVLVYAPFIASRIEAKTGCPQTNSSIAVKKPYSFEDLNQKVAFNMNDFLILTSKDKI